MHIIPFFSTLVTFIFMISVFRRYQKKHGIHLLLWTIGLIWYGIGTLSEVILGLTYNGFILKFWYLAGAMMAAAWLGQGTIHLLVRKRGVAKGMTIFLGLVSALAAILIFTAPFAANAPAYQLTQAISSQYKDILTRNGLIIALTIMLNIYGTLALVGGAAYSAFIFWRKRVLFNRMVGNIMIATGALMPAMAGSFVNLGMADVLYLSELVGVILMYSGFIKATTPAVNVTASAAAD
jgi:hypothetical protein